MTHARARTSILIHFRYTPQVLRQKSWRSTLGLPAVASLRHIALIEALTAGRPEDFLGQSETSTTIWAC